MIEKDMMNSEIGFGRKVLQVLENNNISYEHTPSGIDTMTIIVETQSFIKKNKKFYLVFIVPFNQIQLS